MMNPFRKRQRKPSVPSVVEASSTRPKDNTRIDTVSPPPLKAGIVIAAAPLPEYPSGKQQTSLNLDHVLPPASDYRQSLIMPHLTRQFAFLRAPDGSLVSPDAMRAHLRAQRARARVASSSSPNLASENLQPHFLTEEEENEIIEQLKLQAVLEGRNFEADDASSFQQSPDSWRDGYNAGTDGFGSWGSSTPRQPNSLADIAESLGHLSTEETVQIHRSTARASDGKSLNAQSSNRAQRERKDSMQGSSPNETAQEPIALDVQPPPALMPGDYRASERSASLSTKHTPFINSFLGVPMTTNAGSARSSSDSLLANLTPEAFKRVSTALEEVYQIHTKTSSSSSDRALMTRQSSIGSDANSFTSAVSDVNGLGLPLTETNSRDETFQASQSAHRAEPASQTPFADAASSAHSLSTNDSMQTLRAHAANRPADMNDSNPGGVAQVLAHTVISPNSSAQQQTPRQNERDGAPSDKDSFAQWLRSPTDDVSELDPNSDVANTSAADVTVTLPRSDLHGRQASADILATARSRALREQPSLASMRGSYRPHARANTASTDSSMFYPSPSPRASGLITPNSVLNRSGRSPSYFPTPSSGSALHDYAFGFKAPSPISPAATAALHTMPGRNSVASTNYVHDASSALQSAQRLRDSNSTNLSQVSPQLNTVSTFSPSDRALSSSSPGTSISHIRPSSAYSYTRGSETAAKPPHSNLSALPEATRPSRKDVADDWKTLFEGKANEAMGFSGLHDGKPSPNTELRNMESADNDDLWTRMAQASIDSQHKPADGRPVSHFPLGLAEDQLAGTGITFDQLASYQDLLIQSASQHAAPPLPTALSAPAESSRFAEAKSKGLASPNIVRGSEWSMPIEQNPNAHDLVTSPRAVTYDVTTSRRPSSVASLARDEPLSSTAWSQPLNKSSNKAQRLSNYRSQFGTLTEGGALPRHDQHALDSERNDGLSEALAPVDEHSQSVDEEGTVQSHPFTADYTSPSMGDSTEHPYGRFEAAPSQAAGRRPSHTPHPLSQDTERLQKANSNLADVLQYSDPEQLMSDVAVQTRAATRALKGVDDGSVSTPPVRSKSLSKKKSLKKLGQHISSPQLISTTQKLDSANQIRSPPAIPTDYALLSRPSAKKSKSPKGSGGTLGIGGSPSGVSGVASRDSNTQYYRRRSSSFGHDVGTSDGLDLAQGGVDATPSISSRSGPSRPSPAETTTNNHPYMNGSAASASLSRFFSKYKRQKSAEESYGGATIEPFPPKVGHSPNPEGASTFSPKSPKSVFSSGKGGRRRASSPESELASPPTMPNKALPSEDVNGAATGDSSFVSYTSNGSASGSVTPSSHHDRSSSGRSLKSPAIYTLPIDSTTMPRSRSKKRTPIVLKRDSEVVMPGDPGYMPFAIISKQPSEAVTTSAPDAPSTTTAPNNRSGVQEDSTAKIDQPAVDNKDVGTAASIPVVHDATEASVMAAPSVQRAHEDVAQTTPTEAEPKDTSAADKQTELRGNGTVAGQTKSLRDTIVRRTIIIPADVDFESLRARSASLLSSGVGQTRQLRRFVPTQNEPLPTSGRLSRSTVASKDLRSEARSPTDDLAAAAEISTTGSTDTTVASQGPNEDDDREGLPTLSSQQSLKPHRTPDTTRSNRSSRAESSYAGSLYDMYIEPEANSISNASLSQDEPGSMISQEQSSVLYEPATASTPDPSKAGRAARSIGPERLRHIEVTERADGSVVWQVIAGLADRNSIYSEYSLRHSLDFGDSGLDSISSAGRDEAPPSDSLPHSDSLLGLYGQMGSNEESRALFTKRQPRSAIKFPELDRIGDQPLSPKEELPASKSASGSLVENGQVDADMSVDSASVLPSSHTRIVYHNDAQLASLLDVLAQGKDSAKFDFQISPFHPNGGMDMAQSKSIDSRLSAVSDANPVSPSISSFGLDSELAAHRSRVEAEIYTLLNQKI